MSVRKWALGLTATAALAVGTVLPATAAFASPTGGQPTPKPVPRPVLQQQEFDLLESNVLPAGSSVLGTGPIHIIGGLDKSTTNGRVDIFETNSSGANSVTINHELLGGATVDRATCSIDLAQYDLPWSIHTGTGIFRGAVGNGVYDLVGQFSFPTVRNHCTLPVGLTPWAAARDLNSNSGGGLPQPLQFSVSVQAVGRSAVAPLPVVPNPCPTPTVWNTPNTQTGGPTVKPTCQPSLTGYIIPLSHDNLVLTFDGNTYTYNTHPTLRFVAPGVLLVGGSLTDTYEPVHISLPIHGVLFGNKVIFSVVYPTTGPDAGNQGVRTFSGIVGPFGHVTGSWSETGAEAGSGPFTLAHI